jgi:phage head maturation protease
VQLLVKHDGLPLARTMSVTLDISEHDHGLGVEADLDPSDRRRALAEAAAW